MIHRDYDCYTVVSEFQGCAIWEHRVVTKDRHYALVISYSPDVKRICPPVYHKHDATGDCGDGYDDCDVVEKPCIASLDLIDSIFDLGAMNQDHSGELDPGVAFWTLMIRRLERYRKGRNNDRHQKEDSKPELRDAASCECSDQEIVFQQDGAELIIAVSSEDVQREERPSSGDSGHREDLSGTTRVLH